MTDQTQAQKFEAEAREVREMAHDVVKLGTVPVGTLVRDDGCLVFPDGSESWALADPFGLREGALTLAEGEDGL